LVFYSSTVKMNIKGLCYNSLVYRHLITNTMEMSPSSEGNSCE